MLNVRTFRVSNVLISLVSMLFKLVAVTVGRFRRYNDKCLLGSVTKSLVFPRTIIVAHPPSNVRVVVV